jgi:hypothetical protein
MSFYQKHPIVIVGGALVGGAVMGIWAAGATISAVATAISARIARKDPERFQRIQEHVEAITEEIKEMPTSGQSPSEWEADPPTQHNLTESWVSA